MSVKTHIFNKRRYKIIETGRLDGITDIGPRPQKRELFNCAKKDTQDELITWIHEGMHAGNWDKLEKTIDQSSKDIGRLLWRLGYRRLK